MSNLIIPDRPWLFLPRLADAIGIEGAIIVQQLFWIMKDAGLQEIEMGQADLEEVFYFIRPRTLRRRMDELIEAGIIVRKQRAGVNSLIHINQQALANLANPTGQAGHTNPGQIGQDTLIRYIYKKLLIPLDGTDENQVLDTLRRKSPEQLFITWWNSLAKDISLIVAPEQKPGRPQQVRRVISEGILDHLAQLEKALRSNPWYSGANDRQWVATLDWLLKPNKWQQVVDFGPGKQHKPMSYQAALRKWEKMKGTSGGFPGDLFEPIGNGRWIEKPAA